MKKTVGIISMTITAGLTLFSAFWKDSVCPRVSRKKIIGIMFLTMFMIGIHVKGYAWLSVDDAGTSTAQFLKLGAGGRSSGMGDVGVAVVNDASSVYWNPAGLLGIKEQSLSFMHVSWLDDINYEWVGYGYRLSEETAIGFGIQYLSYGEIVGTDITGAKTGNFNPNDIALTVSYAKSLKGIDVGGSIKYISSQIKEKAEAMAIDMGVRAELKKDKLVVGAGIENVGSGMTFIEEESPLPMAIKFGVGYNIEKNWVIGADVKMPNDNAANVGLGSEYAYKMLKWRVGYNTRVQEIGGLSGLSVGMGLKYKEVEIDYTYQPYDYMGDSHRISITWNSLGIGKVREEEYGPKYLFLN